MRSPMPAIDASLGRAPELIGGHPASRMVGPDARVRGSGRSAQVLHGVPARAHGVALYVVAMTDGLHDGIVVRGLHRSFGSVRALAGVDLDARPGRVTALIGPNGSGKTSQSPRTSAT